MKKKLIGIIALMIVIVITAIVKGRTNNNYVAEDEKGVVSVMRNIGKSEEKLKEEKSTYIETVCNQAEQLLSSNNFDGAISLYTKALEKYPNEEKLEKKKLEAESLKSAYIDKKIAELESDAQECFDAKEYDKSINDYNELYNLTDNESYLVMKKSAEESYAADAISKAEEYAEDGDFSSAKEVVNNAKSVVEDTSLLEDEINKLDECQPVDMMIEGSAISNIATAENGDCWFERWKNVMGNDGKTYTGIGVRGTQGRGLNSLDGYFMQCELQTCSRTYCLQDYDTISGLLVLDANNKNTNCSMYLEIYCDDQLTYTSDAITTGCLPVPVTADISGAKKVTVVWCCDYPNDNGDNFSDEYSFGFVNVTASKKYSK